MTALTKPGLRLFLSADLAGSTAFKQNGEPDEWQQFFRNFYRQLPAFVIRHAKELGEPEDLLKVWKLIGDEIVFSAELKSWDHACRCVRAFRTALGQFRIDTRNGTNGKLDVKAAGWTAGFPVGNIQIEPMDGLGVDYIGPGMDIGFRLVKASSPRKMHVSVELAWLLTLNSPDDRGSLYMSSGLDLKGVARGREYPAIWLDNFEESSHRSPADGLLLEEERLRQATPEPCSPRELHAFCERWFQHMGPPFMVPFIEGDSRISQRPQEYDVMHARIAELLEGAQGLQDDTEPPAGVPTTKESDIMAGLD